MSSRSTPLLLALLALAACRAPAPDAADAQDAYTLVLIQTGPASGTLDLDAGALAFAGHFANMERMAQAHQLLVAGPFGTTRHDESLRGLFVLDTADRAEAKAWASTDPTTQAGVFVLEYHDLVTEAALRKVLEADLERLARRRAAGETPQPGEGARPYVLLTAENGELARRTLEPLRSAEGGVLVLARLDQGFAWAVLDAKDVTEASKRFGPQLASIGAYTLDDWFATDQLAALVR